MPWKSRDAKRIWGESRIEAANQAIEQGQEREAVEIPLD
jgi:hypothetical protein